MSNYSTNHCSITPLPGETQAKNIEEFAWNKPYGGNEDSWQLTPEEEARLKKMELSRKERGLSSVETPEEKIERLKWEAENEKLKEEITSKERKTAEEIKKANKAARDAWKDQEQSDITDREKFDNDERAAKRLESSKKDIITDPAIEAEKELQKANYEQWRIDSSQSNIDRTTGEMIPKAKTPLEQRDADIQKELWGTESTKSSKPSNREVLKDIVYGKEQQKSKSPYLPFMNKEAEKIYNDWEKLKEIESANKKLTEQDKAKDAYWKSLDLPSMQKEAEKIYNDWDEKLKAIDSANKKLTEQDKARDAYWKKKEKMQTLSSDEHLQKVLKKNRDIVIKTAKKLLPKDPFGLIGREILKQLPGEVLKKLPPSSEPTTNAATLKALYYVLMHGPAITAPVIIHPEVINPSGSKQKYELIEAGKGTI